MNAQILHSKTAFIIMLATIAMLAGAQVWLSHLRYEISLETASVRKEQTALVQETHKLGLELASLTRPERLRKVARTELGMAAPRPVQVIHQ